MVWGKYIYIYMYVVIILELFFKSNKKNMTRILSIVCLTIFVKVE